MALDKLFAALSDGNADPRSLLKGFTGSSGAQGALGGAASGALVSALMNAKARKKLKKNAVKFGGVAALAGVGYFAYRQWQQGRSPGAAETPPPPPALAEAPPPPPPPLSLEAATTEVPVSDALAMKMVLAMIAAAAADETIDSEEMTALVGAIENAPVTPDERSKLTAALNHPPTVESLAAMAADQEEASELYGAALTAISVDTPAEDLFLRRLASALRLDPELVKNLHLSLEA